jgi:hypothetical protein
MISDKAMQTDDMIQEIESLPAEERLPVAECILRSLNQTVSDNDQMWAELATKRCQDIQTGRVTPVDADQAFQDILRRFD